MPDIQDGQTKGETSSKQQAAYLSSNKNLCLIPNFLCSTVQNVTLIPMAM